MPENKERTLKQCTHYRNQEPTDTYYMVIHTLDECPVCKLEKELNSLRYGVKELNAAFLEEQILEEQKGIL
jgi:hypothetical protein